MKEDEMLVRLRSRGSFGDDLAGLAGEYIQHLRLELDMAKAALGSCAWMPLPEPPTAETKNT